MANIVWNSHSQYASLLSSAIKKFKLINNIRHHWRCFWKYIKYFLSISILLCVFMTIRKRKKYMWVSKQLNKRNKSKRKRQVPNFAHRYGLEIDNWWLRNNWMIVYFRLLYMRFSFVSIRCLHIVINNNKNSIDAITKTTYIQMT